MNPHVPRARRVHSLVGSAALAVVMLIGVGCGSSTETVPTTTTVATDTEGPALVKNKALNNCVSVMSGERPPPGVTIPRCVPDGSTTPPRRR